MGQLRCFADIYLIMKEGFKITRPDGPVESDEMRRFILLSSDAREDKVADLKESIIKGEYKVDADQVAERIIHLGAYVLDFNEMFGHSG